MKYLSIDEVTAACSSIIKGITKEERYLVQFWAWDAERQIGCNKVEMQTCELLVDELQVTKPSDHLYTLDLALIDTQGNDVNYNYRGYKKRIHPITRLNNPKFIDVYESEDCIHLDSTGDKIKQINLRYWAYPVDAEGNPKIPDMHLPAIMAYVRFMYNMREDKSYSQDEFRWKVQATKARGKNVMPDVALGREIVDNWMTLIPKGTHTKFEIR